MTVGRGGRTLQLTSEGVFKTLKSIAENRGRKVSKQSGRGQGRESNEG